MRHIVLLDKKIPEKDYQKWVKEDVAFWKENCDITPTYEMIRTDYTNYPTWTDSDGDIRPTQTYLKSLNDPLVKKYGEFGYDFAMVMIHEDNWKSDTDTTKGIWGTNYSHIFGKQCLDYCRWDKDNSANTFGTAYHERHHSFDAIIKVETGVDVLPLLGVTLYDHHITHGNQKPWLYIRHKENLDSLKIMKPHLQKAFAERARKHEVIITGFIETIISLASKVVYLLKMQGNKKNGIPRS
jgi:hypothetical protein